MSTGVFNRETILDALVNIVPLGIIAFFLGLFLLSNPWSAGSFGGRVIQMGLLTFPFLLLVIITYATAKRI